MLPPSAPLLHDGATAKYAAPDCTGPLAGLTTVLSDDHSLPSAHVTCCMRSSLAAISGSGWGPALPNAPALMASASGVGPGFCCTSGGWPYTWLSSTALRSVRLGTALSSVCVLVSAPTAMRLSRVALKSSALRKYSVPLLVVACAPPCAVMAGCSV